MTQDTGYYLFYAGIPTFGGYPHSRDLDNVDIAVMGVPFDAGTTNRPSARLGPNAVRNQSRLFFGFNNIWGDEFDLDHAKEQGLTLVPERL